MAPQRFTSVRQKSRQQTARLAALRDDTGLVALRYEQTKQAEPPIPLLEFGSVFQYPIDRFLSKTPRDRADMDAPPMFYYGFYLPTALLVFILCLVYSALLGGYKVLGVGLVYFILGYFTYKYQLVYAMDQPQHATGGAWRMICYRVMLGLIVSQITMSGYLALKKAFVVAALVDTLAALDTS